MSFGCLIQLPRHYNYHQIMVSTFKHSSIELSVFFYKQFVIDNWGEMTTKRQ